MHFAIVKAAKTEIGLFGLFTDNITLIMRIYREKYLFPEH